MFSTPAAAEGWRRAIVDLLKSPLLANREALQALLRLSATNSGFPLRVKTIGDRRILTWLAPQINQPEMRRLELELEARERRAFSVRFTNFVIHVQYGKSGTIKPVISSVWDHLPVVKRNDLDFAIMMRAMSLASIFFNPDEGPIDPVPELKLPVPAIPKPPAIAQPPKLSVPR